MTTRRRLAAAVLAVLALPLTAAEPTLRPPAVPLVTYNPFLSIWSGADRLTDRNTMHWTHRDQPLVSLVRIDGQTSRLMGASPADLPAFPQTGLRTTPTRSLYDFDDGHVHVALTFLTTALPDDLEATSRPGSYLTWSVKSVDGAAHSVQLYDSTSGLLSVNLPAEPVVWARETAGPLTALRIGTQAQPVLGSAGDDHRINWGWAYAAAKAAQSKSAIGAHDTLTAAFAAGGSLPAADDTRQPRAANADQPVLAFAFDLGQVGAEVVTRQVFVAYDEVFAIKWFGQRLRPYWRRHGASATDMLQAADRDYARLAARCEAFDAELTADLTTVGGAKYAAITALAWRQAMCACGLAADANGQPLFFTKENTSNGDIATVDVFYPMDPMLIALSPSLAKASVVPVLLYGSSPRWRWPCSPHDLGTYPIARGTDDGGEAMPVEESGNMILLCDAICQADGNADWVAPWWPTLTKWVDYLEKSGLDPENQLCTDDFMGHLAHNANLAIKAIVGLAAYGDMCRLRGDTATAERYIKLAKADAEHWMKVAADDGRYRLAYDKPGTWSQKYNLVWDKLLGLNVFPPSVAATETAWYKRMLNRYGVPLDSRTKRAKTDWEVWSATLADSQADFETLVNPIFDYFHETTARDALADHYDTVNVRSGGMHARPVIGGLFIKLLADRTLWRKWAARDKTKVGGWAGMPVPPTVTPVLPTAEAEPVNWRFTTAKPADDWFKPDFDASAWKEGAAPFGTNPPGLRCRSRWSNADLWLRRTVTLPAGEHAHLRFWCYHDEDVTVYVNGVQAAFEGGFTTAYGPLEITPEALALLKPGATVTLAVQVHQTMGGQGIDLGLADVVEH